MSANLSSGVYMVNGILAINLDPPYASFSSEHSHCLKNCTVEELRALLIDLQSLKPQQSWPPREYVLRLPGNFARETLVKFGLSKLPAVRSVPLSKQGSKQLATA